MDVPGRKDRRGVSDDGPERNIVIRSICCIGLLAGLSLSLCGCSGAPSGTIGTIAREPAIYPEYGGIVIPPNIAPLNFAVQEKAERYYVVLSSAQGEPIRIASQSGCIAIPEKPWRRLLDGNRGQPLSVAVFACSRGAGWSRFKAITDTIAPDPIDPCLVYRKINLCVKWMNMGIFQRDLGGFTETPVVTTNDLPGGCMNCHSFRGNDPGDMIVQIRSSAIGTPMLLHRSGEAAARLSAVRIEPAFGGGRAGFTAWHPTRPLIVFSSNSFTMLYHTAAREVREVFDQAATLSTYTMESGAFAPIDEASRPDRLQTMPAWSPDGRYLYFCDGPRLAEGRYADVQCDLLRLPYDTATGLFGARDTVLTAAKAGGSITDPCLSPDGRFIAFTLSPRSDFPIHQARSRLCLLTAATGSIMVTDSGANYCDAWHGWSSNGRWLVYTSKRMDGRFGRPFFRYMSPDGRVHKPFVLPQRNPLFYRSQVLTYNIPLLVTGPVPHYSTLFTDRAGSKKSGAVEEYPSAPAVSPLSHQKEVE
jgi:hypothetical protein